MPFEGTKAPEGPKFISDSLGDRPAPPGGQNVGRAFGTNGKTEDKSAAAIPNYPSLQQTRGWYALVQTGPHGVLTAQKVDSPSSLPVIIIQSPKGLPSVRAHRLVAGGALQTVRRRASTGSVMGSPLGRPVPLPRRLPTAGDRLSLVRISIKEQAVVEKSFPRLNFTACLITFGDECELRQEWRRDQQCHVPARQLRISLPPHTMEVAQPSPARRWAAASALFWRRSLESSLGTFPTVRYAGSNTVP